MHTARRSMLAGAVLSAACGLSGCGQAGTATTRTATVVAPGGPTASRSSHALARVVRGRRVRRSPDEFPFHKVVRRGRIVGGATFVNHFFGWAIARGARRQYVLRTGDRGRTWRIAGPALWTLAKTPDLEAGDIDTACGYDGPTLDATQDGGRRWRSARFDGIVVTCQELPIRSLLAVIDGYGRGGASNYFAGKPLTGPTVQYVSHDAGRSWHRTTRVALP